MPDPLRIVQLNFAYDAALADPPALLDRYITLTQWARAVSQVSARVHVIQRFHQAAHVGGESVTYQFVSDDEAPMLDAWSVSRPALAAVVAAAPDVVHINGLMFPAMTRALRDALPRAAIVLQDHSGHVPALPMWPLRNRSRTRWADALGVADAVSFTARELASRWHTVGLPQSVPTLEILESSTTMTPVPRGAAGPNSLQSIASAGRPIAMLWVGRLNENKDPLTVLDGLEPVLPRSACELRMIYTHAPLEEQVRARIDASPALRHCVTLIGEIAHDDLSRYYTAADIFVSGSHHEGSGYALLEAMACGVTPVVTDIPAFRMITGNCGARFEPGNAAACTEALLRVLAAGPQSPQARTAVQTRFTSALSWDAIALETLRAYSDLVARRREAFTS